MILRDDAVHELAIVRGHEQRALVAPAGSVSSQISDSRSRWFDGSSSSIASGRISRMRARATRIFQPPESLPTSPSIISCGEAEAGQDLAGARLEGVAAELLEARLHLAEALEQLLHLVGALGIGEGHAPAACSSAATSETAPAPAITSATTRRPRHLADVLAEVADGDAALDRDLAVVGRLLAA